MFLSEHINLVDHQDALSINYLSFCVDASPIFPFTSPTQSYSRLVRGGEFICLLLFSSLTIKQHFMQRARGIVSLCDTLTDDENRGFPLLCRSVSSYQLPQDPRVIYPACQKDEFP